ncbi:hypothetical protein ACOXXX_09430 [Thalassococcus sp. BH17M4-6]|uniref:hypothetical protein n=1 Tax=Thalassococcus sp. BH17M4-6 TaxID=3413148 RepID=UPI003BCE4B4E
MSGPFLLAFAASFVIGPVTYATLLRATPRGTAFGLLAAGTVAAVLGAFALRQPAPVASLACLWFAWVLAITLFVLALRRRLGTSPAWRPSFVTGLLATTLPWFGLATAQMVMS